MNTAVINVKVDPKVKSQAQQVAQNIGISLSAVINHALKTFIRTRTITFSDERLELTPSAKRQLKQSEVDIKAGYVSPSFHNTDDAIDWLNNPDARYRNGHKV